MPLLPIKRFLDRIADIRVALGDHYKPNPLNPPAVKKAKLGGDSEAFHKWIRYMLDRHMRKKHAM